MEQGSREAKSRVAGSWKHESRDQATGGRGAGEQEAGEGSMEQGTGSRGAPTSIHPMDYMALFSVDSGLHETLVSVELLEH